MKASALLWCHQSNFKQAGYVKEVGLAELSKLAKARDVPLIADLGSGSLGAGLPAIEPTIGEYLDKVEWDDQGRAFAVSATDGYLYVHELLPVATAAVPQILDRPGGVVIGTTVTVVLENVDLTRAGHRPAHVFVILFDRGLVVTGAE